MIVSPKVMLMSVSLGAMLVSAGCGMNDGDMKQLSSMQPSSVQPLSVQLASMKSSSVQPPSKQTVTSLQQVQTKLPGLSFDKGITHVKLGNSTQTVSVSNQFGAINIKQGQVKDIEIQTTVVVDHAEQKDAADVANKTTLQVTEGAHVDIKTHSEPYGAGKEYNAQVYLTITLPQGIKPDLKFNQQNGELTMSSVTGTGKINMSVSNGNITATDISEELSLQTTNGNIRVSNVKKSVQASSTNGNVQADHISGPMDIKTINGNLSSKGAVSSIKAVTVTGNIHIQTDKVGGEWNVSSTVGEVSLAWPAKADVKVNGSTLFGKIQTDLPLVIKGKGVNGKIGKGTYPIHAMSNAGLSFMKSSPETGTGTTSPGTGTTPPGTGTTPPGTGTTPPGTGTTPPGTGTTPQGTVKTYDAPGVYGPETGTETIKGNVVVSSPGVTLRNIVIEGTLTITANATTTGGDVYFKYVKVTGSVNIEGNTDSVHFENGEISIG